MLQAPWDDRLWSLLSTAPEEITPAIINENCAKRKKFRLDQENQSLGGNDPLLPIPPSGEWSGEYQDMPCVANQEQEVKCQITFKVDGEVDGCLSCKEGDFKIKGVYNSSNGIVAWAQVPVNPRPNAKATEFYGDVYNLASGPSRITGTFLTSNGRYCMLNLVNPLASQNLPNAKATEAIEILPNLLTTTTMLGRDEVTRPVKQHVESEHHHPTVADDAVDLPTLLAGKVQPIFGEPVVYKGVKFGSQRGLLLR